MVNALKTNQQSQKRVGWTTIKFVGPMHVSNYKATFSPIYLVFLELDIDQPHLHFKILDESKNEVIPRTFHLQLSNKE